MIQGIYQIVEINGLKAKFEFENGEIREVDFEKYLDRKAMTSESMFRPLLDPEYFRTMQLHPEWNTIFWDNGIDLDPNVLYDFSESVKNMENIPSSKTEAKESKQTAPDVVSEFYGMAVSFLKDDSVTPHFYVRYNTQEVVLSIATGEVIRGSIPKHGLRMVREWVNLHRKDLLSNFEESRKPSPQLIKIQPLD